MLSAGETVVTAVSGGPDSLALLHVLYALSKGEMRGLRVIAAHLHHGMRGVEADADARFVRDEAARLGLECVIERADVPGVVRERGLSEEVAGRELRYAFLENVARQAGASAIATGHQADDQVETVLMRVRRGAGPRGASGIPCVRASAAPGVRIIRPLIACTRVEIERFILENGLHPRDDRTNRSMTYPRNVVRRMILPRLEEQWGGDARSDVLRFADLSRRLHGAARELCRKSSTTSAMQ